MLASLTPPITLRMAPCLERGGGEARRYRIAGQSILADTAIDFLTTYEEVMEAGSPWPPGAGMQASVTHETAAEGWLAGRDREVRCAYSETGILIDVDGVGQFRVARPSGGIACLEAAPGLDKALLEETLLGPPLSFALMQRGIWCLHASAVLTTAGAILFLGASGDGKSTLAQWLGRNAPFSTGRLADDILPCSEKDGVVWAHGHFPQLKLPEQERYPLTAPVDQRIRAMFVLDKAAPSTEPAISPLAPAPAAKRLAEQSIGVKLFDRAHHRRHLAWLSQLLGAARVGELRYPHDRAVLPRVAGLIEAFLEA